MVTKRVSLLSFVSACLLWSVAVFSDDVPDADTAATHSRDAIQLTMLKDARQPLRADTFTPADQTGGAADRHGNDDGQPVAGADAGRPFDDAKLAGLRELFLHSRKLNWR